MSARALDDPDEQDVFLFDLFTGALNTHNPNMSRPGGLQSNTTSAPATANPWVFEPHRGQEVFLVDSNGTSIGCSSARLHRPSTFDPASAHLDQPEHQTNNIFVIDTIGVEPSQANEQTPRQFGLEPLAGRGDSIRVGAQNLVPVGNKPGETYLIRQQDIYIFEPFQDLFGDDVVDERRYSLLVRQAWVKDWQRMYRVARVQPSVRDVFSESELEACRSVWDSGNA